MAAANEPPPERDVKDFRYQQLCRFQIDEAPYPTEANSPQLIASSSKYGIFFVGTRKGFKVIKTSELSRIDRENAKDRTKVIVRDYPCLANVELSAPPSLIAINCDNLYLAVAIGTAVFIYDVRSFVSQGDRANPFLQIRLQSQLEDLAWNPENPTMLACVMEDGSISLYEAGDNLSIKASAPASAAATCVCWSPKGKQMVVGQKDGKLAQYDQALVKKKEWSCPNILTGPQKVVGLTWLSTFIFMAAYLPDDAELSDQPTVVLITASKEAPIKYTSFEDPCYGGGEDRKKKFSFHYIPSWEMISSVSSTAVEIVVIGKHFDNKNDLERWNLEDSARAEIPLAADHSESYSMGVAFDFSSQMPMPLTEERSLPPCPIMLVLSSEGVLIPFYMVYTHQEAPPLTTPPAVLTGDGAKQSSAPIAAGGAQGGGSAVPGGPSFQFVSSKPAATPAETSFSFSASKPSTDSPGLNQPTASSSTGFGFSITKPSTGFSFGGTAATTASAASKPSLFGAPSGGFSLGQSTNGTSSGPATATGSGFSFQSTPATKPTSSSSAGSGFSFSSSAAKSESTSASGSGFSFSSTAASQPSSAASTGSGFASTSTPVTKSTSSAGATGSGFSFQATQQATGGSGISFGGSPATKSTTSTPVSFNFAKPSGTSSTVPPVDKSNVQPAPSSTPVASKSGLLPTPSLSTSIVAGPAADAVSDPRPQPSSQGLIRGRSQPVTPPRKEEIKQPPQYVSQTRAPTGEAPQPVRQTTAPAGEEETVNNLDSTYTNGIMEEMAHFEEELRQFRSRTAIARSKGAIGTDSEMQKMKKATEDMMQFNGKIKKETKDQNKEVEDLKSLALDSFSMVEECKMREQRNTDPKYLHLLKSKTLDPANQERLRTLQQKFQILDRGLRECDNILDNQWQEYQNKNKKQMSRIMSPTTDLIYRSIKSNKNVIINQRLELSDLESQLKQLRVYNKTSSWADTITDSRNAELSSLADSLLESRTAPLSTSRIAEPPSPDRMARLREHLSRRSVPRIKSTRPENLSSSRLVSVETQAAFNRSKERVTATKPGLVVQNGSIVAGHPAVIPQQQTQPRPQAGYPGMTSLLQQTQGAPSAMRTLQGAPSGMSSLQQVQNNSSSAMSSLQQQVMNLTGTAIRFGQGLQPAQPAGLNVSNNSQMMGKPQYGDNRPMAGTLGSNRPTGISLSNVPIQNPAYEDITPPSSGGYEEDDETETETNDDDYDEEFGLHGDDTTESENDIFSAGITSTPLASVQPEVIKSGSAPPSRKLFEPSKPPEGSVVSSTQPLFGNSGSSGTTGFAFGASVKAEGKGNGFAFGGSTKIDGGGTGFSFGGAGGGANGFAFGSSDGGAKPKTSGASVVKTTTEVKEATKAPVGAVPSGNASVAAAEKKTGFNFGATSSSFGSGGFGTTSSSSGTGGFGTTSLSSVTGGFGTTSSSSGAGGFGTASFGTGGASGFNFSSSTTQKSEAVSSTSSDQTKVETSKSGTKPFGMGDNSGTKPFSMGDNSGTKPFSMGNNSAGSSFSMTGSSSQGITGLFGKTTTTTTTKPDVTEKKTEPEPPVQVNQPTSSGSNEGKSSVETGSNIGETTPKTTGAKPAGATSQGSSVSRSLFGSSTSESKPPLFGQKASSQGNERPNPCTGLLQQLVSSTEPDQTGQETATTAPETTKNRDQKESTTENVVASSATSGGSNASGGLFGQPPSSGVKVGGTTLSGQAVSSTSDSTANQNVGSDEASKQPISSSSGAPKSTPSSAATFGSTSSAAPSSSAGFGQTTSTGLFGAGTQATTSVFGQTSTSSGLFGKAATSSSSGTFGQPSTAGSTSSGLFGTTSAPTSSGGLFGATTATTSSGGLFGAAASTSSGGLFGATTATTSSGALFGTTATSSSSGLFGTAATSSSSGLFGSSTTSSSSGVFGSGTSSSSSVFGQPSSSGSGVFGQTSTAGGGLFGQAANSSSGTFGQAVSSSSVFGQPSTAGTSSVFGQPATSNSTSVFGQPVASSGGGFGQTSTFGSKPQASGFGVPAFGQAASSGSGFGQQSAFGQSTSSPFGQTVSSSSGGLFGGFGGLGGQASAEKANTNVFGTTSFGNAAPASSASLFGGQQSSGFGVKTSTSFGGGGGFTGGGGSVASTGFGVASQQQTQGGFGSPPAFGTSPSFGGGPGFGSQAAFGGSPAFGGGATFGSQPTFGGGSVFGSPQQAQQQTSGFGGFGTTGSSPTFEALAGSSNVPTFGGLSQQSPGFGGGGGFGASPSTGFGTSTPPNNPSFTGYRS